MLHPGDDTQGYVELVKGIRMKTVVYGQKTLTAKFRLKKGAVLPRHLHPHEQTGYMIAGRIEFVIDGHTHTAVSGDTWCIEGNVEHGATVIEDSEIIEVFSPVRIEYLPENLAASAGR